jgi:hypothetical protein
MLALANTGYYSHSCNVSGVITTYEEMRKDMLKRKRYGDVAYIDGYINGLFFLLASDQTRKLLPLYYVFGAKDQPVNLTDFKKVRRKAATLHKAAYQSVLKGAQRMTDLVPQHMPYFL